MMEATVKKGTDPASVIHPIILSSKGVLMELTKSAVAESMKNFSFSSTSSPSSRNILNENPIKTNPISISHTDALDKSDNLVPLNIKVTPPTIHP